MLNKFAWQVHFSADVFPDEMGRLDGTYCIEGFVKLLEVD